MQSPPEEFMTIGKMIFNLDCYVFMRKAIVLECDSDFDVKTDSEVNQQDSKFQWVIMCMFLLLGEHLLECFQSILIFLISYGGH